MEEIASVASLIRNDNFLGEGERWRRGVTRNDTTFAVCIHALTALADLWIDKRWLILFTACLIFGFW